MISVDAELGRGFHGRTAPPESRLMGARERWPTLLDLFDEYGLVDIPDSLHLLRFEGWPRTVVESVRADPVVESFGSGLDAAAVSDEVLHCWLHPNNIVADRDVVRLRAVLSMLADRRADGEVAVETTDDVAWRAAPGPMGPTVDTEVGNV